MIYKYQYINILFILFYFILFYFLFYFIILFFFLKKNNNSQLEAIVRISESFAKMRLSTVVTESDVQEALELFKNSTMDAVNQGQGKNF